jgi:bla regulator protein blaR1
MLTWIVYVLVITLLLSGAALTAEYATRLRHSARSRWIWGLTIVASLVLPTVIASVSIQVPSLMTPTVSRKAVALRELTSISAVPLTWVHEHTGNIAAVRAENRTLQHIWVTVSVALFAALIVNGAHVSWRKRRWKLGTVAGVTVYIAPDVGPAVVGLLRPRIVVPAWLAEGSRSVQSMVIAHEQAHLSGHDPQLLTIALCLVVLMPWNFPLWWQLHRLRYAIEVDCDARVLESGVDTRLYGEMLIDVSQRPSAYIGAVAAMSESRSFLEDRIAIMVRDPARWGSIATVTFGSVALALVAVAAQVTPPNLGSSDAEERSVVLTPEGLDQYVGFYVRGANIVFRITRDGKRLLVHVPWGLGTHELVADSQMNFACPDYQGVVYTFVRDAEGNVTEVLEHHSTWFTIPMRHIDEATAETIKTNNAIRAQSQTPVPGSEAALRRLLDDMRTPNPSYDEVAPWFAELLKQTQNLNQDYVRWGVVKSIEFRGVEQNGGDLYEVHQQGGFSNWIVWLTPNGIIEDADNHRF